MPTVSTIICSPEDAYEGVEYRLTVDEKWLLYGCGCCGSPRIGTAKYPAKELAEVIEKAVQEYVNSKENV